VLLLLDMHGFIYVSGITYKFHHQNYFKNRRLGLRSDYIYITLASSTNCYINDGKYCSRDRRWEM